MAGLSSPSTSPLLLAALVAVASSSCSPSPRWVASDRALLALSVRVVDLDPLVVDDCEQLIMRALKLRGFELSEGGMGPGMQTAVEVAFPDQGTADVTATLHPDGPPRQVLASSRAGGFYAPAVDLRLAGGRRRTQACYGAAERFADAMVDALGAAPEGPPPGVQASE